MGGMSPVAITVFILVVPFHAAKLLQYIRAPGEIYGHTIFKWVGRDCW